jgi:hypothetical protein
MEKQNEIQMKMMEMAAAQGALTPEVMQEFLRQQTAQKAIDGSDTNNEPTPPSTSTCNQCQAALMPDWKVCPYCGAAQ